METLDLPGAHEIDDLMGEFMRDQDVVLLRAAINGAGERVGWLREEIGSAPGLASHYRRGARLCMRYAYWRTMTVPEDAAFLDASGCVWTATGHDDRQIDMLVMRTAGGILVMSSPSREEDESWVRAMGFLDALDHLNGVRGG